MLILKNQFFLSVVHSFHDLMLILKSAWARGAFYVVKYDPSFGILTYMNIVNCIQTHSFVGKIRPRGYKTFFMLS